MTIIRSPRPTPFTALPNGSLRDGRLTFKARGLLAYLLSMPDGWQTNSERLAKVGPDGRDAIRAALRELEDAGYIVRRRHRTDHGTFATETIVHDEPVERAVENTASCPPPTPEKPTPENPSSKERTTKKELTTKALTRTKESRPQTPRICGDCDGTGWTLPADDTLDLIRCTCSGGVR